MASIEFPTRPSRTLKNSSSPIGELTLVVIFASTLSLSEVSIPNLDSINGFTKSSDVTTADTGYPGIPIKGVSETIPNTTG